MNSQHTRRGRRDLIQNIAITLLTVSAVLLSARNQLSNLSLEGGYWGRLLGVSVSSGVATAPVESTGLSAPVRVAVSGAYGRYGNLTLTTADEAFAPLGALLGEALGSAKALSPCTETDFFAALSKASIYYDFLDSLPLSVLAETTGAASSSDTAARRLVISARADGAVQLHLWGSGFSVCDTAVTEADLTELINNYELGGAHFAFDGEGLGTPLDTAAPCSLFLTNLPELSILSVSDPLTDADSLLTALGFNPHTNSRYEEPDGTEVILENDCSLRIAATGTVRYLSGSSPTLLLDTTADEDDVPALREAADGAWSLLSSLLSGRTGEAQPYLQSISQSGKTTTLRFGYQVRGVPIRFADGGNAAEVVLSGSAVTGLTLRFRQYTPTDTLSLLLPLRQALAIAARIPGGELSLGYADNGGDTVSASWLSD